MSLKVYQNDGVFKVPVYIKKDKQMIKIDTILSTFYSPRLICNELITGYRLPYARTYEYAKEKVYDDIVFVVLEDYIESNRASEEDEWEYINSFEYSAYYNLLKEKDMINNYVMEGLNLMKTRK